MSERVIYLDHNATTPLDPEVLDAMLAHMREFRGNPASRHSLGRQSRKAIDLACRQIAAAINCDPKNIIFTSGATESNHLAIRGLAGPIGSHILVNPAEHPSAMEPAKALSAVGYEVEQLPIQTNGQLAADIAALIRANTTLLIQQFANSETGTIQDVQSTSDAAQRTKSIRIHVDAAQAAGKIPLDFGAMGVSTLSLSAHKLNGPTGIGALIFAEGIRLAPLFVGGHQQGGARAGTEPITLIAGLGKAMEVASRQVHELNGKLAALRDKFEQMILAAIPDVSVNGDLQNRLPNTSNLSFLGANGQALVIALDLAGICCSAGSACASGSMEPSPVLMAMKLPPARFQSAVRFTLGKTTTEWDVTAAVDRIINVVRLVRKSRDL